MLTRTAVRSIRILCRYFKQSLEQSKVTELATLNKLVTDSIDANMIVTPYWQWQQVTPAAAFQIHAFTCLLQVEQAAVGGESKPLL